MNNIREPDPDPDERRTEAIVSLIATSDDLGGDAISRALEQPASRTTVTGATPPPDRAATTWIYEPQSWSHLPARRQLDTMLGYIEEHETAIRALQGQCRFRLSVGIRGGGDVPPENLAVLPHQLATLSALGFEIDVSVYFL